MFGKGISRIGDILDLAADNDIIVKSGAWYAYEGNKIGQGRENAKLYLEQNPDVCAEVETKVRELFDLDGAPAPADGAAKAESTASAKSSSKAESKADTKE